MWIGSNKHRRDKSCPNVVEGRSSDKFKYFGVNFFFGILKEMKERNHKDRIQNIHQICSCLVIWSQCNLTLSIQFPLLKLQSLKLSQYQNLSTVSIHNVLNFM